MKDEKIQERLFAAIPVQIFSSKGMKELLQVNIKEHGPKYEDSSGIVCCASNMWSEFNRLIHHIENHIPDSVYIWCHSYVLNLLVVDFCTATEARNRSHEQNIMFLYQCWEVLQVLLKYKIKGHEFYLSTFFLEY